ncbi:MAG TPA: hypothetical protein VGB98_14735 [Pyrinomonadaceae bacterium]
MRTLNGRTFFHGGRRLLLSLILLSASTHAAAARQAAPKLDWREFTSEAGGFTIKFPGEPRLSHPQEVRGPYTVRRNVHEVAVGNDYTFLLDYSDFPGPYKEPDSAFEGGISALTNPMIARGGRLLTKEKVERGTCVGREATVSTPIVPGKTGFVQGRVFNSGRRFYMLIFVAAEDSPAAREIGRAYVDSLVIRDGCRTPVAPAAAAEPAAEPVRRTVEGTPDAATGWRRIESAEHGFGVLMPGPAALLSSQPRVEDFTVARHEYVHEGAEAIYTVEVKGDYPQGFFTGATAHETMLDIGIHGVKKGLAPLNATFGEPRKLSAGPYPGREYAVTNEQTGLRGRVQLYATPRRTYVFFALARGKGASAADLERFFSSVKVSPK